MDESVADDDRNDERADRALEAMRRPRLWPPLVRRSGGVNVVDLTPVDSPWNLPGHRLILLMVLQLAVSDRATELRFEPWRFPKDECFDGDAELGMRMFYEVQGELEELVPPPHWFLTYFAREIEAIARMDGPRERIAHLLRRLASKIDGRELGPRLGRFALGAGDVRMDVEVLAYPSTLGERYFLRLSPIPDVLSEKVCSATRRLHGISDDPPFPDPSET